MARVVLGMASSHGPTMRTPPGDWDRLEQKDRQDPRFGFEAVLRKASTDLEREVAPEKKQQRYQACQGASNDCRRFWPQRPRIRSWF